MTKTVSGKDSETPQKIKKLKIDRVYLSLHCIYNTVIGYLSLQRYPIYHGYVIITCIVQLDLSKGQKLNFAIHW